MSKKIDEAELDHAIVVGMIFFKTPNVSSLVDMSEQIAKNCDFSSTDLLPHIQKRSLEAIELAGHLGQSGKEIGFAQDNNN